MSEFFDYEEDCGYELDDPKHPTFYDRMCDRADLERKQAKENPDFHDILAARQKGKPVA